MDDTSETSRWVPIQTRAALALLETVLEHNSSNITLPVQAGAPASVHALQETTDLVWLMRHLVRQLGVQLSRGIAAEM